MKKILFLLLMAFVLKAESQVQRAIVGQSVIRDNILAYSEFNFFRDWNVVATFKSGIGEGRIYRKIYFY